MVKSVSEMIGEITFAMIRAGDQEVASYYQSVFPNKVVVLHQHGTFEVFDKDETPEILPRQ